MMGEKFSRRVSADQLWTEEDIADSIAARMDEADDDPSFIAHALGVVARAPNLYRLARDTGLTRDGRSSVRSLVCRWRPEQRHGGQGGRRARPQGVAHASAARGHLRR